MRNSLKLPFYIWADFASLCEWSRMLPNFFHKMMLMTPGIKHVRQLSAVLEHVRWKPSTNDMLAYLWLQHQQQGKKTDCGLLCNRCIALTCACRSVRCMCSIIAWNPVITSSFSCCMYDLYSGSKTNPAEWRSMCSIFHHSLNRNLIWILLYSWRVELYRTRSIWYIFQ